MRAFSPKGFGALKPTVQEIAMSAALIQFVFRPNPGANLTTILELAKESAELWRKYGADVSLWTVQVGEIGNMAFIVRAESTEKMGKIIDSLNGDQAFVEWRAKSIRSGLATWVRSNQAVEVPI
jgi:hypothetical protein